MPPLSGEERILTVFADIHYYFSAPTPKPLHHRFDKGSYLYLYHNASQRKTRLEVANNPGSPDQDAFNGALDQVHIAHSTKFPTLCTLTVDGANTQAFPPPPTSPYEWHLPSTTGEPMRLHTLDIYFWTLDDATQCLDLLERHLAPAQVASDRHPFPPPAQHNVSSVVQQLEHVAIADPAYQNGQTRNSQSEPASFPQHHQPAASTSPSIATPSAIPPPPPPITGSPGAQQHQNDTPAPLPYNPAAPAAPEPIKHREKTPPPPMDGADGTGLAAAAAADIAAPPGAPFSPQRASFTTTNNNYTTTSQSLPYAMPGSYASPPPSAGLPPAFHVPTSSIQSPPPTTVPAGVPSYTPSFLAGNSGSAGSTTPGATGTTMSFAPPPKDPSAPVYQAQPQTSYALPPQLQQHQQQSQPTPPPGGYANFSYDTPAQARAHTGIGDYEVHSQLYRPTEAEANSYHQKHALKAMNSGQKPRGLEERAHRVENSVNKFLKRLEKKI
ncbi:conserved hypothetical protein [Aspergillus terreus NIH2624]|uniref:RNA recognition motif-containing protein n=1 Tax=Aspergillus terreus (strain NIH 2624 / FGSC A1156) TaxID=341663 RepID=Q0CRI9_ASPTN|nr:uncharacterized protein ATEG_03695 [Aspergillus terreus NIH2624]EAU35497.1 conserved hypothetical protein [Aspergillus terreus NIH2624]